MIKPIDKVELERDFLIPIKSICEKHKVNIILNALRLNAIPLRSGKRETAFTTFINIVWANKFLKLCNKPRKLNKRNAD